MANARRRTQRTSRTATRMATRTAGNGSPAVSDAGTPRSASLADWQQEMHYINKDLRDLLIVTVILFVLLFVVGFFL